MLILAWIFLTLLALSSALVPSAPADLAKQLLLLQPYYQYQSVHYYPENYNRLQTLPENQDTIYLQNNHPQPPPVPKLPVYITQDGLVYVVPSLKETEPSAPQPGYVETIYNWLTGPPAVPVKPASEPQPPISESLPPLSESELYSVVSEQGIPFMEPKLDSNQTGTEPSIVAAEGTDKILPKVSSTEGVAKLEQLEPEAELVPETQAEQGRHRPTPQQPPLLPGAPPRPPPYYIVQQPHLFGNNPHYFPLPNYRPQINFPEGYQRFYIISPQPRYDSNYAKDQDPKRQVEGFSDRPGLEMIQQFGVETIDKPEDNSASAKQGPVPGTAFTPAFAIAPLAALPFYGHNQPAQQQFGRDFPVHRGPLHFSQYVNLQQRQGAGAGVATSSSEEFSLFSQLRQAPLDHKLPFKEDILNLETESREQNNAGEIKPPDTQPTTLGSRATETFSQAKPTNITPDSRKEDDKSAELENN